MSIEKILSKYSFDENLYTPHYFKCKSLVLRIDMRRTWETCMSKWLVCSKIGLLKIFVKKVSSLLKFKFIEISLLWTFSPLFITYIWWSCTNIIIVRLLLFRLFKLIPTIFVLFIVRWMLQMQRWLILWKWKLESLCQRWAMMVIMPQSSGDLLCALWKGRAKRLVIVNFTVSNMTKSYF